MDTLYLASSGLDSKFSLTQIPQGIAFTEQYLLVTLYNDVTGCSLIVLNKNTRTVLVVLRFKDQDNSNLQAHLGGIAYDYNNNVFISGKNGTIMHIPLSVLEYKISAATDKINTLDIAFGEYTYLESDTPLPLCSSFLTVFDNHLYLGVFEESTTSLLHSFQITFDKESLQLSTSGLDPIPIPKQIQGITFYEKDKLLLTQSYGRRTESTLYICEIRDNTLYLRYSPITLPPLAEGITFLDDTLYILYESSAHKYRYTAKDVQYSIWSAPLQSVLQSKSAV